MSAFSDTAFGKNTAFSDAAFDFGAGPAPAASGGHFAGKRKPRRRREMFAAEISARARLREQIRTALYGPEHIAQATEEAIAEYIAPQKTDSRYLAPEERIRWDLLYRQLDLVEASVLLHIVAAEEEDDEDWLLLNG